MRAAESTKTFVCVGGDNALSLRAMAHDDWPGMVISSWSNLVLHATTAMSGGTFIFRGQSDSSWRLTPTLLRHRLSGSAKHLVDLEMQALEEFRSQAHLYIGPEHLPAPSDRPLSWWSVMQHYAAPTRLLDWTASPFVAAYFAVQENPDRAGVVFVADVEAIRKATEDVYGEGVSSWESALLQEDAPDALFVWKPARRTARSVAQQGIFTGSVNVGGNHDSLGDACRKHRTCARDLEPARRWIFEPEVKDEILRYLRTTNIAAHSLFPGLDGLGRSIGEIARIGRSKVAQTVQAATISGGSRLYPPSAARMAADQQSLASKGLAGSPLTGEDSGK